MSVSACDPPSHEDSPSHSSHLSVLHIDDETVFLDVSRIYLGKYGIVTTPARSVREGLCLLESGLFTVILSDYQMPDIDGIEFLRILQRKKCTTPFIMLSGANRDEVQFKAMIHGASYYIQKYGDPRSLFAEVALKIREYSRASSAAGVLEASQRHYRMLAASPCPAMISIDEDLVIIAANSGFRNMTGYQKAETEGVLRWTDIIPPEDARCFSEHLRRFNQNSLPGTDPVVIRLITKDRAVRFVSATITRIPRARENIVYLIDTKSPRMAGSFTDGKTASITTPAEHNPHSCTPKKEFIALMIRNSESSGLTQRPPIPPVR